MCAVALQKNRAESGVPDLVDQGRLDARYYNANGSRKDTDDRGVPIDWEGLDEGLINHGKDPKLYNPDGSRKDKGPDGVLIDWENVEREQALKRQQDEQGERRAALDKQMQVAQDKVSSLGLRINLVQAELHRRQAEQARHGVMDIQMKVEQARLKALQQERDEWVRYRDSFAPQEVGKKL